MPAEASFLVKNGFIHEKYTSIWKKRLNILSCAIVIHSRIYKPTQTAIDVDY